MLPQDSPLFIREGFPFIKMNLTEPTSSDACFCGTNMRKFSALWGRNIIPNTKDGHLDAHTDADLAAALNALTFAERQAMEADIHGVDDVIEETPVFVADKIEKMRQALERINSRQRQAWDRAVFLRPALARNDTVHLTFLRARRFRPEDAAEMMVAHFQAKRELFGDDLLIHRITWDDVCSLVAVLRRIWRRGLFIIFLILTHAIPCVRSFLRRNKHFSGQVRISYFGSMTERGEA